MLFNARMCGASENAFCAFEPRCKHCLVHPAVWLLQVALAQGQNLSWFGYPDDTSPSIRDFLPGLREVSCYAELPESAKPH